MAEQPPDKRARPNHPHGASQDWSKVTRAQLPIVLTVAERPNIEQLKRFANSPYGGKTIAELSGDKADDDDEQATYAKKSAREVIAWYIRNISSQKVVFVDYARCVVGAMLVEEGIIANSRIYPISSTLKYPFSITQLPKVIRELAIGQDSTEATENDTECTMYSLDDSNAFHRIVRGLTKDPDALRMSMQIIEDTEKVHGSILSETTVTFHNDVEAKHIKTAIHAIANGQSIAATEKKLGAVGSWLSQWHKAQHTVTDERCATDVGIRGLKLIKEYSPNKTKVIIKYGKRESTTVARDCKATLRSFVCQAPEANGLMEKIKFFRANGVTHILPLHDDCMANAAQCNQIAKTEGKAVADLLTDELQSKAYAHALVKCTEIIVDCGVSLVDSDLCAAETLLECYPHWVFCENNLHVFDEATGMYDSTETAHMAVAGKFKGALCSGKPENGWLAPDGYSYGSCTHKFRAMILHLKTLVVDNGWAARTDRSSFGKLLWKNGIYDVKTQQFTEGFDPNVVFHGRINRDFRPIEELNGDDGTGEEYKSSIFERLFVEPLDEETGRYYLHILARALFGDNCDMGLVMFGIGVTRSSKSTITKALSNACGDYVNTFSAESLKTTDRTTDEAAMLRWAFLLRYSRIIISNELSVKTQLSGTRLKSVAGRGDELKGRVHSGLETPFTPHFTMLILSNDLPQINPCDDAVINRTKVLEYKKSFVANPKGPTERKEDANITAEVRSLRFCDAFVHLLISAYHDAPEMPEQMKRAGSEWLGIDDNNMMAAFVEQASLTDNSDDFLTNESIMRWLKESGFECTIMKFNAELKRYIGTQSYTKMTQGQKKIHGTARRGWYGMKITRECDF